MSNCICNRNVGCTVTLEAILSVSTTQVSLEANCLFLQHRLHLIEVNCLFLKHKKRSENAEQFRPGSQQKS